MAADKPDPIYKYIDNKIGNIRREIRQHQKSLLKTQRFLAKWFIILIHNDSLASLREKRIKASEYSVSELVAESAEALTEANKADEPLAIALEFSGKRTDYLGEFGITGISAAYWF